MSKAKSVLLIILLSLLHNINCDKFDDKIERELNAVSISLGACAEYFQYKRLDDFIIGNLTLFNLEAYDTIKLTFKTTHWISKSTILLDGNPQEILKSVQNRQSLSYRIDFGLTQKLPRLLRITLNDKRLCATNVNANQKKYQRKRESVLQHTLEIINGNLISAVYTQNKDMPNFAYSEPLEPRIIDSAKDTCGRFPLAGTPRSEHPWFAAIYVKWLTGVEYKCTGALISSRLVLTSHVCIATSRADFIRVYLGRHDLNNTAESDVITRDVATLIQPPRKITFTYNIYNNNLVLLKMKAPVSFTEYVTPICLWNEAVNQAEIVGLPATLTSWDYAEIERGNLTAPTSEVVNILSRQQCEFTGSIASSTTQFLCVRYKQTRKYLDILMLKRNGTWFLRGVCTNVYNAGNYNFFIDIVEYRTWIQNQILELEQQS